jgi:hypothetical protein
MSAALADVFAYLKGKSIGLYADKASEDSETDAQHNEPAARDEGEVKVNETVMLLDQPVQVVREEGVGLRGVSRGRPVAPSRYRAQPTRTLCV